MHIPRILASTKTVSYRHMNVSVVFVPGIMGSRLKLDAAALVETTNGKKVLTPLKALNWDPDSLTNGGAWATSAAKEMAARLDPKVKCSILLDHSDCTKSELALGWGGVCQDFYRDFLLALRTDPERKKLFPQAKFMKIHAVGYDWRQSNEESAKLLTKRLTAIRMADNPDRLVLITHSMGGIVARRALLGAKAKTVDAVIHIAQPVLGGVVMYRRLLWGTGVFKDGVVMKALLGGSAAKNATIVGAFNSGFELLPTDPYTGPVGESGWLTVKDGDQEKTWDYLPPDTSWAFEQGHVRQPPLDKLYTDAKWPPSCLPTSLSAEVRGRVRGRVISGANAMANLGLERHPATWSIYGTGKTTDVRVKAEFIPGGKPSVDVGAGRNDEGDGTVPAVSAMGLFPGESAPLKGAADAELFRQYEVKGLQHDTICNQKQIRKGVLRLLAEILSPRRLNEDGAIDWELSAYYTKLHFVMNHDASDKAQHENALSTIAEFRMAKHFRKAGYDVKILGEDDVTSRPDLELTWPGSGPVKADVKRVVLINGPAARTTVAKGMAQAGKSGMLLIVRPDGASRPMTEYKTKLEAIKSGFESGAIPFKPNPKKPAVPCPRHVQLHCFEEKHLPPFSI